MYIKVISLTFLALLITALLRKHIPIPILSNSDTTESNKTSKEKRGMLSIEEDIKNLGNTLNLSIPANGFSSTENETKPGEPQSNIDPTALPTTFQTNSGSDEFHSVTVRGEEKTTKSSTPDEATTKTESTEILSSTENYSSSSTSACLESIEALPTTEKYRIPLELEPWIQEKLRLIIENNVQSESRNPDDFRVKISYRAPSIVHGPKFTRAKIRCPPGQRRNHFGECKCPVTLKQVDYDYV